MFARESATALHEDNGKQKECRKHGLKEHRGSLCQAIKQIKEVLRMNAGCGKEWKMTLSRLQLRLSPSLINDT